MVGPQRGPAPPEATGAEADEDNEEEGGGGEEGDGPGKPLALRVVGDRLLDGLHRLAGRRPQQVPHGPGGLLVCWPLSRRFL